VRRIRVVDTFPLDAGQRARLDAVSDELEIVHDADAAPEEVEVLLATRPAPQHVGPALRWLQLGSAGADHLAAAALPEGVTVTNAAGVYTVPVAEYALAAILDAAQAGDERRAHQRERRWGDPVALGGRRVRGATVLVVGYGAVGREVARLASALGAHVVAAKARPELHAEDRERFREPGTGDPEGAIPVRIVGLGELPAASREADYLVATLPGTAAAHGAVGRAAIEALPPHAWVVNVGRGGALDLDALVAALDAGRLRGATLDVLPEEPLAADSPLWSVRALTLTPHAAGGGERWDVLTELLVQNLARYCAGRPLLNRVDLARGY
jgi:phosphoglycerate dehydrogenase-like enzyme